MNFNIKSIRPFLGAENFSVSRQFYQDIGFEEIVLEENLSYFNKEAFGFYLQQAYVKDWVDNTMVFMEVENVDVLFEQFRKLNLSAKYPSARLLPVKKLSWGNEFFVHDPSGILWHFGEFYK